MAMTGHCLCGAVAFRAENVETEHHVCHCGMCRRWAGGSMMCAASEGVTFSGEDKLKRYDSSQWAQRGFCAECGTSLFYFLKPTQTYMLSIGTFDDQTVFKLVREIFIDKKPPGFSFSGDHERWTEEETFARLTPT